MAEQDYIEKSDFDVGNIVVAAYRFQRKQADELDVQEGTRLVILENSGEWWLAETEDKSQRGLIPGSFLFSEEEYEQFAFFNENEVVDITSSGDNYEQGPECASDSNESKPQAVLNASEPTKVEPSIIDPEPLSFSETVDQYHLSETSTRTSSDNSVVEDSSELPPLSPADRYIAGKNKNVGSSRGYVKQNRSQSNGSPSFKPTKGKDEPTNVKNSHCETTGQLPVNSDRSEEKTDAVFERVSKEFENLKKRVASVRLVHASPGVDRTNKTFKTAVDRKDVSLFKNNPKNQFQAKVQSPGLPAVKIPNCTPPYPPVKLPGNQHPCSVPMLCVGTRAKLEQVLSKDSSPKHQSPTNATGQELNAKSPLQSEHSDEERRRWKEYEDLKAERLHMEERENESRTRAAQLREQSKKEALARAAIVQQERSDTETYKRFTNQMKAKDDDSRMAMQKAIQLVKVAVQADQNKHFLEAYQYFVAALNQFVDVLKSGNNKNYYPVIVQRMHGYLQRMSQLELEICPSPWSNGKKRPQGQREISRFMDRVGVLTVMAMRAPFSLKKQADELKINARFAELNGDIAGAFRHYSEAIEYLLASNRLHKEKYKNEENSVTSDIMSMLSKAETLKKCLEKKRNFNG